MKPWPLDYTLLCITCRFNVRGVTLEDACPGCGDAVRKSALAAVLTVRMQPPRSLAVERKAEEIALETPTSVTAVLQVLDAMDYLFACAGGPKLRGDGPFHIPVRQLAQGFCDYLRLRYEDKARRKFAQCRIETSDDLGAVVYGMVRGGLISKQQGETCKQFEGIFTVEQLFENR